MDRGIDGWMDDRIKGWMDGWMDDRIKGWMDEYWNTQRD
jgi:hypothetical protein